ncbi:MAG: SAM hydrolase/SAM-dependent halogenase family protein, partial [Gammaproteobacteria bacterium]
AVMKGVILSELPGARIIDLTHEVHVHWPAEAGFWLSHSYQYFPEGTVHIAVVDPGVGTSRDILGAECNGHFFLAPDNGLLPAVLDDQDDKKLHRLSSAWLASHIESEISSTFHGRDIFAPLGAGIASGKFLLGDIGPEIDDPVPSLIEPAEIVGKQLRGIVIAIDHFGNLITNIDAEQMQGFSAPVAQVASRQFPFKKTYGTVTPGNYLALINSFGVVEIARAEGSAADSLGLGWGAPVNIQESAD